MDPQFLCRDSNLEKWMKDSGISPLIQWQNPATTSKKTVLLTGCTGYLGKHILLELLNSQECCLVYCHVRASGNPRERLLSILRSSFVGNLATLDLLFEKIRIVEGDLSKPLVGLERATFDHLASTVDVIIHNGAVVNQIRSYKALRMENVESTKDMLRLALQGRPKFLHFISTMGVVFCCNDGGTIDERVFPTAEQIGNWYQDGSGYRCTKWVSEQLVIQAIKRGYIQGAISRPGLIGPHSVTGEGNKEDWFNLLLSAILEIGFLPTSSFFTSSKLHLIPVDYVAKGVAAVSLRGRTENDLMLGAIFPVYHYWYSHNPIIISEIMEYLKTLIPLTEIDYTDFKEILANSRDKGSVAVAKTSTILSFVSSSEASSMREFFEKSYTISDEHTRDILRKNYSIVPPPFDQEALARYCQAMAKSIRRTLKPSL